MLRSMTGFGSARAETDTCALRVEVRSVNHRHLLVKLRLPGEFHHLEGDLERKVRRRLDRGSVAVHVHSTPTARAQQVHIDADVARGYQAELEALRSGLGLSEGFSPDALLGLPGVLDGSDKDSLVTAALEKVLHKLLGQALDGLVKMRETEGKALQTDLERNAEAMGKLVARIDKRMPQVVRGHQKALKKRVGELLGRGSTVSEADLAREIALLADRLDVSEEVSRLGSHLDQFGRLLPKGGSIGRKLDFLVQEIFREVNTIGSKCSDAKVAHWVVDAKTHVERLREQVQNIE